MFCINDMVMYGNNGVYKIVDIRPETFGGEKTMYYVLAHIDDSLTMYCPVANSKVRLRQLLSREEIRDLIQSMPDIRGSWIENDQKRNQYFTEVLRCGSHKDLIQVIKLLYMKKQERCSQNKKMHLSVERIMKEAEKILYEEFAYVLDIATEEVVPFIKAEIKKLN